MSMAGVYFLLMKLSILANKNKLGTQWNTKSLLCSQIWSRGLGYRMSIGMFRSKLALFIKLGQSSVNGTVSYIFPGVMGHYAIVRHRSGLVFPEEHCRTTLPFLNLLFTSQAGGGKQMSLCRKTATTDGILMHSSHPQCHLGSRIRTLFYQVSAHCNTISKAQFL